METRWHCIHIRPRKESRVAGHLAETLGLETYYPRLRRQRTIRRVRRVVTEPLFPRYLFSRFDFSEKCRAVQYAPDVLGIVSFGGIPAAVDESLISGLKGWAGDVVDVIDLRPALRAGDRVEINDGPLRGLRAVIQGESGGGERVAVILSLLEQGARLTIDRGQLTRLD